MLYGRGRKRKEEKNTTYFIVILPFEREKCRDKFRRVRLRHNSRLFVNREPWKNAGRLIPRQHPRASLSLGSITQRSNTYLTEQSLVTRKKSLVATCERGRSSYQLLLLRKFAASEHPEPGGHPRHMFQQHTPTPVTEEARRAPACTRHDYGSMTIRCVVTHTYTHKRSPT